MTRLALAALFVAGCAQSDAVDDCLDPSETWQVPGSEALTTFSTIGGSAGAGRFGRWVVGPHGLPEYAYTLAEDTDPVASWPNSEQRTRTDHWHLVGNQRLNATAYNEGYLQVYAEERGPELLDRFDPPSHNFGGGYSIVRSGDGAPFATAYAYRPAGAQVARSFGMGYARNALCRRDLLVTHTLSAPPGDRPFVVDEVRLENRTSAPLALTHDEVWDVNRHYLKVQLLRSGTLNPGAPSLGDAERDALDGKLITSARVEADHARILNRPKDGASAAPDAPADENPLPPDVFLAALDGGGDRFITDGAAFWGADGTPAHPAHLDAGTLAPQSGLGQPGILVAERSLTLQPHEVRTLRYAFGAVPEDAPLPDFGAVELAPGLDERRRGLAYVDVGDEAVKRELAWHAYYLENLGGWSDYFQHFVVNQGSAYYYLHGLDGAVRDFVFSTAALSYLDPHLARETLLYAARMRRADGTGLAYATAGYGQLSTAVIHAEPSDLDLFFFWGVAEYVFATGDRSLLDALEPLWPRSSGAPLPLTEHLRLAARHLIDRVGTGPHGLLRVGDGDWDDGIVFFASDRDRATATGESVANAAMATVVLPWAAALLDASSAGTAAELRALAGGQRTALAAQWTGEWYRRAWFGADEPFGDDALYVLPNAFALAGDNASAAQAATLVGQMKTHLEDASTTGIEQFWMRKAPAHLASADPYAGTNPAITALAVWGYRHADGDRAWDAFAHSTMARKADAQPDLWYGIWSGPDAQYTSATPSLAGQTWVSQATPQTDYPVLNSNAHAGVLLGFLRAAGLEPVVRDGRGCLRVAPRGPAGKPLRFDLPLLRVETSASGFEGEYRPITDGTVCLAFAAAGGASAIDTLTVGGVAQPAGTAEVIVTVPIRRGVPVSFAATTR